MKTKLLTIALIIMIHLVTLTACAQAQGNKVAMAKTNAGKEQVGNVYFVTPANWEKLNNNGQVILVAPNTNGSSVITILPSERVFGSLETWFRNFLDNNQKGRKLLSGGEINKGSSDEGYSVFSSEVILSEQDGSKSYRLYVAVQPDNVELVALISTNKSDYEKHKATFEQFVYSLDFTNIKNNNARSDNNPTVFEPSPNTNSRNNSTNTNTSISNNSISGLFVGTISRQQFNPNTKFYDYVVRQQYYLFGPGGKVYFGLPSTNIRDIDQACQQDPSNCGEYLLSGSQLQLFRPNQQAQSFNLIKTNNGFKLGNSRFYPINTFDGLRLNGTYSFRSFTNLSGAGGVSGGVSGERTISFNSNGQFVANNFVGFAASGGVAGAASSTSTSGQGRYQITGNTITLSYSNGREEQFVFFIYPENEQEAKPGLIVIGGVSYLLRD